MGQGPGRGAWERGLLASSPVSFGRSHRRRSTQKLASHAPFQTHCQVAVTLAWHQVGLEEHSAPTTC